jgi:hypothetical protein
LIVKMNWFRFVQVVSDSHRPDRYTTTNYNI